MNPILALVASLALAVNAEEVPDPTLALIDVAAVDFQKAIIPAGTLKRGPTKPGTTLESVLLSVDLFAPQIVQLQSEVQIAQANELIAASSFDPVISARYNGRLTGFYGGQVADIDVRQRLNDSNINVYGGYSISQGRLPVYEDQYLTNNDGEFRAGAEVALLRGRTIDPERARLRNARLQTAGIQQTVESELIQIKADAAAAFVDWVYAEQIRLVYEELYEIAELRVTDIDKAISAGQLAAITRDENQQLVFTRQSQLLKARQNVLEQRARLGFFLRGENGTPSTPVLGNNSSVPQNDPYGGYPIADILQSIHDARPDIVALQLDLDRLLTDQKLAENDQQADLSFKYEVRRDFGRGSETRAGTDHKIGLELTVPIEFAQARGKIAAARAKIKALKAEIRVREDRAQLALYANQQALQITEQQVVIGASEIKIAQTLQIAEEARYLQGASDVFRLNAQETALANSKFRLLGAQRDHDMLLIDFYRITGRFWF